MVKLFFVGKKTFENYDEQKTFSFRLFKITNEEKNECSTTYLHKNLYKNL